MTQWRKAFSLTKEEVKDASPPGTVSLRDKTISAAGADSVEDATIVLIPWPTADPANPLNWSAWRKTACMATVAFYAFVANFISSSMAPALPLWNRTFPHDRRDPHELAQLIAFNVLSVGLGNVFWVPFANVLGRRHALVLSTALLSAATAVGYHAPGFRVIMLVRILQGLGSSASETIVPAVVGDLFFIHQRGRWMALVTASLSAGAVTGGIAGGFIAGMLGWRGIFVVTGAMAAICHVLTILLVPETMYDRPAPGPEKPKHEHPARATAAATPNRTSSRAARRSTSVRGQPISRPIPIDTTGPQLSLGTLPDWRLSIPSFRFSTVSEWLNGIPSSPSSPSLPPPIPPKSRSRTTVSSQASIPWSARLALLWAEGRGPPSARTETDQSSIAPTNSTSSHRWSSLSNLSNIVSAWFWGNEESRPAQSDRSETASIATSDLSSVRTLSQFPMPPRRPRRPDDTLSVIPESEEGVEEDQEAHRQAALNRLTGQDGFNEEEARAEATKAVNSIRNSSATATHRVSTTPSIAASLNKPLPPLPGERASRDTQNGPHPQRPDRNLDMGLGVTPPAVVINNPSGAELPVMVTGPEAAHIAEARRKRGPTPSPPELPKAYKPYTFWRSLKFSRYRGHVLRQLAKPWTTLLLPATWVVMLQFGGLVGSAAVMSTVGPEILSAPPYRWGKHAGLLFIGPLAGIIVGGFWTGIVADRWIARAVRKAESQHVEAEGRVGMTLPALAVGTLGLLVFGACARWTTQYGWLGLEFGYGMVSFALAQVPSIWFGYLIDSYHQLASDIFVMICILRGIIPFGWTFFVDKWIQKDGILIPFVGFACLLGGFALLTIPMMLWGKRFRIATAGFVEKGQ